MRVEALGATSRRVRLQEAHIHSIGGAVQIGRAAPPALQQPPLLVSLARVRRLGRPAPERRYIQYTRAVEQRNTPDL